MRAPTLVIHYGCDLRVGPEQGIQLLDALRLQGVHAALLIFPEEDHGMERVAKRLRAPVPRPLRAAARIVVGNGGGGAVSQARCPPGFHEASMRSGAIYGAALLAFGVAAWLAPPSRAWADGPHAGGAGAETRSVERRSVEECVRDLALAGREARGVQCLGGAWDEARATSDWDDAARGPRAFAERVAPVLRALVVRADRDAAARRLALRLLVQLVDPASEPMLLETLASPTAPGPMRALAADGLARFGDDVARAAIVDALVRSVASAERAPLPEAWALCAAVARAPGSATDPRIAAAAERLFLFAPQGAVQACLPLLRRMPALATAARDVLDGRGFPVATEGDDPRDPDLLVPAGRGAALLLLAELHTPDAMTRLASALDDATLAAGPTRDGAVQGLAVLGGRRARRLLRAALADPRRRSPRVAHALLRLGDASAAPALRLVALDPTADVDTRLSAANAYTLVVSATSRDAAAWESDLARTGSIGPPFEALDARIASFGARVGVAARCARRAACWAAALADPQGQVVTRALWQLARTAPGNAAVGGALTEAAVAVIAATPANQEHDRVAAALALLAREPTPLLTPHRAVLRRARAAWEGRTTPMGLPFDIPLALAQLDERIELARPTPAPSAAPAAAPH